MTSTENQKLGQPTPPEPERVALGGSTDHAVFVSIDALLADAPRGPHALVEVDTKDDREAVVPGAIRLNAADFAGEEGSQTGRLPLPSHERLTRRLLDVGIDSATTVLVYARDDADVGVAARGWVTLRWAGVRVVRFFNRERGDELARRAQSLSAWVSESKALREGDPAPFRPDPSVIVTYEDVAGRAPGSVLVDARVRDIFATGHIPGSINVPVGELLAAGALAGPDPAAVRAAFGRVLPGPVEQSTLLLSCGSGIAASVEALLLASQDVHAPVYIGSWSEWSKRQK